MPAPLLGQRQDRLGADRLAAAGVHTAVGHAAVDGAEQALHHVATAVDFGDDSVSKVSTIGVDDDPAPAIGAVSAAEVLQDITLVVIVDAGHDDAGFIRR